MGRFIQPPCSASCTVVVPKSLDLGPRPKKVSKCGLAKVDSSTVDIPPSPAMIEATDPPDVTQRHRRMKHIGP